MQVETPQEEGPGEERREIMPPQITPAVGSYGERLVRALGEKNLGAAAVGGGDVEGTSLNRETIISMHNISISASASQAVAATASKRPYPSSFSDIDAAAVFGDSKGSKEGEHAVPLNVLASDRRLYIYDTAVRNPQYPHALLQICSIEFDPTSGKAQRFFQNVSDGLLRVYFSQLPSCPFVCALRNALNITLPNASDLEMYKDIARAAKETENIRDEILSHARDDLLANVLAENEQNSHRIHCVDQSEYAVVNPEQKRWLATYGASDCFIVGIYPRQNCPAVKRAGALAHIDGMTDAIGTLQAMRGAIGMGVQDEGVRYAIILLGGGLLSVKDVISAFKLVKKWEAEGLPLDIVIGRVFTGDAQSLAIDLESGDLSVFVPDSKKGNDALRISCDVMSNVLQGKTVARRHDPQS